MSLHNVAYPRAETQAKILARVESGMLLAQVASLPGYPPTQTIYRWAKADASFAQALSYARGWGREARLGQAMQSQAYDPVRAEAFLLAVRQGARVRDLVQRPQGPSRKQLNAWRRQRPDFAQALVASTRFSQQERGPTWARFDQQAADRIVLRVSKGEPLPRITRDPTLPGAAALRRWRRRQPEFDRVLKMALLAGHRRRKAEAIRLTPELTEATVRHIIHGGSLSRAAQAVPGGPSPTSLWRWRRWRPDFAAEIAAARQFRDEMLIDRILDAPGPEAARLRKRLGQLSGGVKPKAG